MPDRLDTMMDPPGEELLDRCQSKFSLVTLAAKRARQINSYYNQLGDGLGSVVPPQVASKARKPLSIAFEEITSDKVTGVGGATGVPLPESMLPVVAEGDDEAAPDGA